MHSWQLYRTLICFICCFSTNTFPLCKAHFLFGGSFCFNIVVLIYITGTKRERGLVWDEMEHLEDSKTTMESEELYDMPFGITSCLSSQSWVRYIPFCPWRGKRTQGSSDENNIEERHGSIKNVEF